MSSITAQKLEERWTPTTIQTAFNIFGSLPSMPPSSDIIIGLPLLNLGWTFSLSLTREEKSSQKKVIKKGLKGRASSYTWRPVAFSFRQHGSAIRWRNASIRAKLWLGGSCPPPPPGTINTILADAPSLGVPARGDCPSHGDLRPRPGGNDVVLAGIPLLAVPGDCPPHGNTLLLGTINAVLAHTPSLEVPLTTLHAISSLQPQVWLTVTLSDCPFAHGLFEAHLGPVYEAQAEAQLVRQSSDRLLSRSLTTGKLFDVKFLARSTRSTSGNDGEPLPTYASLAVLAGHVNISSCE